jgi:ATP sulfurylase
MCSTGLISKEKYASFDLFQRETCSTRLISKEKYAALASFQKRNVHHLPHFKREMFTTGQFPSLTVPEVGGP